MRGKLTKLPSDYVNVRGEPSVYGVDLGDLKLGAIVTYYPNAINNGWVYVIPTSGKAGWVSLQTGRVQFTMISEPPPPPPPPPPPTPPTNGGVRGKLSKLPSDYVNVRAQPSLSGTDLGDLRLGDVVTYFPNMVQNGWIYVRPDKGSAGWVLLQNGNVQFTPISEPPPPEPPVLLREGIDVSQAQATPDWDKVADSNVGYVIARAAQGIAISLPVGLDTRFHDHMRGAMAAGIPVGVYHTFIPKRDGVAQAEFFYATIERYLDVLVFPPAIDVEVQGEETKATIADRLHAMAVRLTTLSGQKPMIYTAPGFWNSYVGAQWDSYFGALPLWVAHWTGNAQPLLPRGWKRYALWQFSNNSSINGITGRVDRNRLA